jgi:PAS domain S-box-containing protein
MSAPIKFLLVDDLEPNLMALEGLLKRDGLELLRATSGAQALELLLIHDVALAFLDVQMPEMDGFELAELMRGTERTRHVPIIFVTAGATNEPRRFRGYELGAVDFLYKPIDRHVLKSKADVFFDLARQRRDLQAAVATAESAQQRFQLAARATNDAIWDWNLSAGDIWWNDGLQSLFGYLPAHVSNGAQWLARLHPEDRQRVEHGIHALIHSGEPFWRDEYRFRRANGSYAEVFDRGYVIRDEAGKAIRMLGAMQDVTERVRTRELLEEAVRDRTAELQATNDQLETFVYSIAHDLRAPLRAMTGYSQLLLDDHCAGLNDDAQRMLQRIRASSGFMDKLLLDLLLFSHLNRRQITLSRVDVAAAWKAALLQCAEPMDRAHAQIEGVEPMPHVLAHEATLGQCLANLLSNSLKFVKPGAPPRIRFWSEQRGDTIRLWLTDNGIGIPETEQRRAFQDFERLDGNRFPGTGIGLTIVRKGVERMGGQVGVDSKPGQGSSFWIDLPRA